MGVPLIQQVRVGAYLIKQRIKGNKQFPLVLMLEPLFRCNLACAGCGKIDYPDHILNKRLTVQECIDAVEECGAPMVAIPGGEPLLHKEIGEIVAELIKRKKFISLCTNALILEKKLDLFTPSPYLTFTVHLDGDREHHDKMVCQPGGYDIAVAAIKKAKAAGFRVNINTTLFDGIDVPRMADFFTFVTNELKVDGINASPGYAYERAPDQQHFLGRQKTKQLFRDIFRRGKGKKWNFNQSSLFLDFLAGNQEYHCTPWSMPTRNVFGWQRPCYLIGEGYTTSFKELMTTTEWETYGTGKYEKCANCMVHCGYEGTAVEDTFKHPLRALKVFLRGPRTEGPMAKEIDLTQARRSERLHEKHVYDFMAEVPLNARDKRWFESRNLPLPEQRANDGKAPAAPVSGVAAE